MDALTTGLCIASGLLLVLVAVLMRFDRAAAAGATRAIHGMRDPANLRTWARDGGPFLILLLGFLSLLAIDYPSKELQVAAIAVGAPLLGLCAVAQWRALKERGAASRHQLLFEVIAGYGYDLEQAGIIEKGEAVLAIDPYSGSVGVYDSATGFRNYDGRKIENIDWIRNGLMYLSTDPSYDAQSFAKVEDVHKRHGIVIRLHLIDTRTPYLTFSIRNSADALYWFKRFQALKAQFAEREYVDAWQDPEWHRAA